ncbi:MAG: endonuclease/exonuclease/phosphatase family protein [Gaiellaceae bacterium]
MPQLLIRSWNLYHGNANPPERSTYLEHAVRLATADRPDVLVLQELPVWALEKLGRWSGMQAFGEVAARPRIGPLPSTAAIGRAVTSIHPGALRSAFAGQANAILLAPELRALERRALTLNARGFRHIQSRRLELGTVARLAWAKERRMCGAVRAATPDGRTLLVAGLHATSYPADRRLADAELLRAAVFADALAAPEDVCVLAGDFNVEPARSRTLPELVSWGFSVPGSGIDHVLVRNAVAGPLEAWPPERRRLNRRLLSDHAPVEVRIQ